MKNTHNPPADQAWESFLAVSHEPVEGTVVQVVPFGAFVRVAGVDGLLPLAEAKADLAVGDRVRARLLQVDAEARRFSLQQV